MKQIASSLPNPEQGACRVWNAGGGARVAPRDYTGGDIRRGGGAITVHCRLLSGGAGKTPPFYKHRVDAPLQAYRQDHPHEEAEQRRDMPRRELPAMAPQDWAHNPKEREPRGSGVTSALGKNDCITQHYSAHLTNSMPLPSLPAHRKQWWRWGGAPQRPQELNSVFWTA